MVQYTDEEFNVLSEKVVECDPCGMLKDIQQWQETTTNDVVVNVLDTVSDIIIDNTTWSN